MVETFLTISHILFLNREERYKMSIPMTELDTIGICLPVWVKGTVTSEPAEEIFCHYKLRNFLTSGIDSVYSTDSGFILSLDKVWEDLLDIKDGGAKSIYLTYHSKIKNEFSVINYIKIEDIEGIKSGR